MLCVCDFFCDFKGGVPKKISNLPLERKEYKFFRKKPLDARIEGIMAGISSPEAHIIANCPIRFQINENYNM